MINDIKQSVIDKIAELYPKTTGYTIYDEDVPQSFKKKSFRVLLIDQDYNKRLSNINNGLLSFDIAYFSDKPVTEVKEECLLIQENLMRSFDLISNNRILNKKAGITDNVLHMTFDIRYSEIKEEEKAVMQKKQLTFKM